jgi:hypothetical protein
MSKILYVHVIGYYSNFKRRKFWHATPSMKLENIMLSETNAKGKILYSFTDTRCLV